MVASFSVWAAWLLACGCGGTSRKELEQHQSNSGVAGASGTAGAPSPPRCSPATIDPESGVETCGDAATAPGKTFTHRAAVGEGCSFDASVADTCNLSGCPGPFPICDYEDGEAFCGSGCGVDADCAEREYCQCMGKGQGGRCQSTECLTDQDCAAGTLCASFGNPCGLSSAFACQSLDDQCVANGDCPTPGEQCVPVPLGSGSWRRICVSTSICPSL